MPNRLVGANPPVLMPEFSATAITMGSMAERRAAAMASGITTYPACADPIEATPVVMRKNR